MKINTIPLKIVVSVIMVITVILSIVFGIGIWEIFHKPDILFIKVLFYFSFLISLLLNLVSCSQVYKILKYMDKDVIFTKQIQGIINRIKKITYAVFVVLWGIFPMMYHAAMITKVYATIPIALVFIFSPLILSTFTAVIEQLLRKIIEIKSEHDLTV
ncbi:DUF2975 domain-containing protein [Lactococcus lactis]|jgi:hypothetical protein|uniref:DUF2975 domain-containing protein n=1 Tax=Lactococcus lactis TaxID=1358 RepID=A0A3S3PC60_9LACT|nr:DUF2975 domain-containing protein [Lactococcus lactis]MCT1184282.1 DUF2975 domain-containing protein [Lactococcus lactis]MCT1188949.1 DUF2975 domain-containing protein [Lactococcus lactis]MDG4956716.1 DUF2975 domain-containing protein [Lactococcus lactis]MDR2059257.1 DUF2975 domain-containing protein [Lactococcus lactis]NYZ58928.1 DUF2975 domain-containing protein [Lactococcus lactis]